MFTGLCFSAKKERAVLRDQIVIVDPAACHGEDDEIVINRLRVGRPFKGVVLAIAVQRVGHDISDAE